jgi:O-antigen/teichoic acid export membrane protein
MGPRIRLILSDKLYANSLYLIGGTGVMALFGFVFWILIAHAFRATTVGLATTTISISSLLALLSLAGFDTILIRYLAKTKRKDDHINTGLILVGIVSVIVAGIFCMLIPSISPRLRYIDNNVFYATAFILFTAFTAWNVLTNAIFIAYRQAHYVLVINIVFSAIKMILPFFIKSGGPMTIFLFVGIAQFINVAISILALMHFFKYKPSFKIHTDIVKEMRMYGFAAYLASFFNLMPDSALPIVVVNKLGAAAAAYFYIAFTIANLLYNIGFSTAQSLLSESSTNEKALIALVIKSIRFITYLLVPSTIIFILLSHLILVIFGHNYAQGAKTILIILSASSIFVVTYSVMGMIFKARNNLVAMISMNFINAASILTLSIALAPTHKLAGIGWAWLLGNVLSVLVGLAFFTSNLSIKRFFVGRKTIA